MQQTPLLLQSIVSHFNLSSELDHMAVPSSFIKHPQPDLRDSRNHNFLLYLHMVCDNVDYWMTAPATQGKGANKLHPQRQESYIIYQSVKVNTWSFNEQNYDCYANIIKHDKHMTIASQIYHTNHSMRFF